MLVAEWRECIAIKRQWEKGTLNHRLVSYIVNYDKVYFRNYMLELMKEMYSRHINFKQKYIDEFNIFWENSNNSLESYKLTYPEHNDRYLVQCYFNLQEKYDRKMISEDDWKLIQKFWNSFIEDKIKK